MSVFTSPDIPNMEGPAKWGQRRKPVRFYRPTFQFKVHPKGYNFYLVFFKEGLKKSICI